MTAKGPPPGFEWDATGSWHVVTIDWPHGTPEGDFNADLAQDEDGNISFVDPNGILFTLTRVGQGGGHGPHPRFTYRVSALLLGDFPPFPCELSVSGSGTMDAIDNVGSFRIQGIFPDCDKESIFATVTRN